MNRLSKQTQDPAQLDLNEEKQLISVSGLTKKYGSFTAIQDVSFSVGQGEIVGFLGPNGAGKSTTMNILTGCLSSTAGTVTIDGHDILEEPEAAKKCIGYLPEQPPLYPGMTVTEYLRYICGLRKIKDKDKQIALACALCRIGGHTNRLISELSKGYRQRVGIAQALLGEPPVLILDEPTSGLDPAQIIEIRQLIRALSKKHTVILSSHILSEIQAVCGRIIIISGGKIIADDSEQNLTQRTDEQKTYNLRVAGAETQVLDALKRLDKVASCSLLEPKEKNTTELLLRPKGAQDIRPVVFDLLCKANLPILLLKDNSLTLEQVFMRLIDDSARPPEEEPDNRANLFLVEEGVSQPDVPLDSVQENAAAPQPVRQPEENSPASGEPSLSNETQQTEKEEKS